MKTKRAIWESNSSSSHSITLTNGSIFDDTIPINSEDGKIHILFGEFGWEWKKYNDALTKASYVATYVFNDGTEEQQNILTNVIKDFCGAEVIYDEIHDEYHPKGYIDHQSSDDSNKGIHQIDFTYDSIKKFIFCKESYLVTGNDNTKMANEVWNQTIKKENIKFEFTIENHTYSLDSINPKEQTNYGILGAMSSFLDEFVNSSNFRTNYFRLDYNLNCLREDKSETATEETINNLYRHLKKGKLYEFMVSFGSTEAFYDKSDERKYIGSVFRNERLIFCEIKKI